jgi:T5SS/PEP-CTERM-associated repeat protein
MIRHSLFQAGRRRRSALAAALAIGFSGGVHESASAAVTTIGAVTPVPPAGGGAIVGASTIGDGAYGSVSVTSNTGLTANGSVTLGNGLSGIGYLSLNGYGSNFELTVSGLDMLIGDEGIGSVSVANLAKIVVPDDTNMGIQATSSAKLAVTGLGTTYLNGDDMTIGLNGSASVEVLDGGSIDSSVVLIADNASAIGSVLVSGELSHWHADDVAVGDAGSGRLELAAGGRFTVSNALQVSVQNNSYGELIVDGIGSRLQITGGFNTGVGDALVTLSNGGTMTTGAASQITPTGRVTLAGGRWASTLASNTAISVSGLLQGSGTLDAQGVAIVGELPLGRLQTKTGDHLLLTGQLSNSGLVDLAGGELEVRGILSNNRDIDARNGATLRAGGSGLDNNSGSQLAISGGAVDVFGMVDNNTGAEIAVVGGATGVFHDPVINSGKIYVSASSEIVMLENLTFVPAASLAVQVANLKAGDGPTDAFGMVSVGDSSTLAGALAVSLAPGFAPTLGETFTILTAANGISGTFASESLPALGGGLSFDVQYTPNAVMLAVVGGSFLAADFDKDGDVDSQDLTIWKGAFGATALGDANGDAKTDGADYLVWQRQYGKFPAATAATAVPEPAAVLLALLAAPLAFGRRK